MTDNMLVLMRAIQALQWKQEMFTDGASSMETGTKLYISNLEYGVSNDDMKVFLLVLLAMFSSQFQ